MSDITIKGDNGTTAIVTSAAPVGVVVGGQLTGPPGVAGPAGPPGPQGDSGSNVPLTTLDARYATGLKATGITSSTISTGSAPLFPRVASLLLQGHSFMDQRGIGQVNSSYSVSHAIQRMLGMADYQVTNIAVSGGAIRYSQPTNGGVVASVHNTLQQVNPGIRTYQNRVPPASIYAFMFGTNDAIFGFAGGWGLSTYDGFVAGIARCRSGSVYPYDDSSVSTNGTQWTKTLFSSEGSVVNSQYQWVPTGSGLGYYQTSTTGSSITITTPTDLGVGMTSANIYLHFITGWAGATATISVDGGGGIPINTGNRYTASFPSYRGALAYKINIPTTYSDPKAQVANTHTITINFTGQVNSGTLKFNGWAIEATQPGLGLVYNMSQSASPAGSWVNEQDPTFHDQCNDIIWQACQQYDGMVRYTDMDTPLGGQSWQLDGTGLAVAKTKAQFYADTTTIYPNNKVLFETDTGAARYADGANIYKNLPIANLWGLTTALAPSPATGWLNKFGTFYATKTNSAWQADATTIIPLGQLGLASDTGRVVIGDGVNIWGNGSSTGLTQVNSAADQYQRALAYFSGLGLGIKSAWTSMSNSINYSTDRLHPSPLGAQLIAEVAKNEITSAIASGAFSPKAVLSYSSIVEAIDIYIPPATTIGSGAPLHDISHFRDTVTATKPTNLMYSSVPGSAPPSPAIQQSGTWAVDDMGQAYISTQQWQNISGQDSCVRPNSSTVPGGSLTAQTATWGISSNNLVVITKNGANPNLLTVPDTGSVNHWMQVTFNNDPVAVVIGGCMVRYVDANNWLAVSSNRFIGGFAFTKCVGGTVTSGGNISDVSFGAGSTMHVEVGADDVVHVWGRANLTSSFVQSATTFPITDAVLQHTGTGTKVGIYMSSGYNVSTPTQLNNLMWGTPNNSYTAVGSQLVWDTGFTDGWLQTTLGEYNGATASQLAGIMFRCQDDKNFYRIGTNTTFGNYSLYKIVNGVIDATFTQTILGGGGPGTKLAVQMVGNVFTFYINGVASTTGPITDSGSPNAVLTGTKHGLWMNVGEGVQRFENFLVGQNNFTPISNQSYLDISTFPPYMWGPYTTTSALNGVKVSDWSLGPLAQGPTTITLDGGTP